MRKLAPFATLALIALPAVAWADDPPSASDQANAAKLCSARRAGGHRRPSCRER